MGSDKYVYFTVEGEKASAAELEEELAADVESEQRPAAPACSLTNLVCRFLGRGRA